MEISNYHYIFIKRHDNVIKLLAKDVMIDD
jgi:hypothetical protein